MTVTMTAERIDRLPVMQKKIMQYNELLDSLYSPVGSSWNIGDISNQRSIRSKTERALDKIEEVRDLRDQLIREYAEELCAVESWLLTVKDPEVEVIARLRLCGMTYRAISQKMYGNDCEASPRTRVSRYFKRLNEQETGNDSKEEQR